MVQSPGKVFRASILKRNRYGADFDALFLIALVAGGSIGPFPSASF